MKSSSLEEIKIMKDVRNLFRLKKKIDGAAIHYQLINDNDNTKIFLIEKRK